MKLEKLLRDISLRGIAFLVILIGLWSVVLMVGVSFGWSFLTDKVADAFYLGGFIAGLLIFALAVSSITANLTIISKTQNSEDQQSQGILKQLGLLIGLSILLVAFLLGGLWFAEWNVYNQRKEDAKLKIETLLEKSQLTLLSEEIKNNGEIEKIIEIRDALSYDISSEGRISFLFPKDRAGVKIYYELTPWFSNHSDNENLAELDLNQFKPSKREKKDFDKLSNGDIKEFIVPIRNNELRVFRSININGQELIILLDTSRRLKDYRGSFK